MTFTLNQMFYLFDQELPQIFWLVLFYLPFLVLTGRLLTKFTNFAYVAPDVVKSNLGPVTIRDLAILTGCLALFLAIHKNLSNGLDEADQVDSVLYPVIFTFYLFGCVLITVLTVKFGSRHRPIYARLIAGAALLSIGFYNCIFIAALEFQPSDLSELSWVAKDSYWHTFVVDPKADTFSTLSLIEFSLASTFAPLLTGWFLNRQNYRVVTGSQSRECDVRSVPYQ